MYRIYSKIMDNLTNVYFIIKSKKNKKINQYRGNIYKGYVRCRTKSYISQYELTTAMQYHNKYILYHNK